MRLRLPRAACLAVAVATAAVPAAADCGEPWGSDAELIAEPAAARAIEAADAVPNARGRLWRVASEPPSYLIGTFHVAAGGLEVPGPILTALVEEAQTLFLEIEGADAEAELARYLADPDNLFRTDGKSFTDGMDEAERASAQRILSTYGMPMVVAEGMNPLVLFSLLSLPPCALELALLDGLDANLETLAHDAGVEVRALETVMEQIEALIGGPGELDTIVRLTLTTAANYDAYWFTMLALYRTGHIQAILTLSEHAMEELVGQEEAQRVLATFLDRLVVERNERMVERVLPDLREGGIVVAVGALHLPGESGIVELLREEGFDVVRVREGSDEAGAAGAPTPAEQ